MNSELIIVITTTAAAFGILVGAITAIYKVARRIDEALGLDSQGRTVSDRLERVEHQLFENGGSSLADRVNNIEKHVVKVSTEIEFIKNLTISKSTSSDYGVAPVVKPVTRKKKAS